MIKQLQQLEEIFVLHSAITKSPYLYQHSDTFEDLLLVFSSKEAADAKAAALSEEKIPVQPVGCKKEQYTAYFTGMYYIGVDGMLLDEGDDEVICPLTELAKAPAFDKMPNPMFSVRNPSLQVSMLYFLQEARRPLPIEEKQGLREMEEEVMVNLSKGKFLIPHRPLPKNQPANGKRKLEMMSLQDKNGNLFQPMFTDYIELVKFTKGQSVQCLVMPFAHVKKLNNPLLKGYVVNPMSSNLILKANQMDAIGKLATIGDGK